MSVVTIKKKLFKKPALKTLKTIPSQKTFRGYNLGEFSSPVHTDLQRNFYDQISIHFAKLDAA